MIAAINLMAAESLALGFGGIILGMMIHSFLPKK